MRVVEGHPYLPHRGAGYERPNLRIHAYLAEKLSDIPTDNFGDYGYSCKCGARALIQDTYKAHCRVCNICTDDVEREVKRQKKNKESCKKWREKNRRRDRNSI